MKRLPLVIFALAAASTVEAHIGSPNVYFVGDAGPYAVRVIVKTPGVVPGLAQITVRTEGEVRRVTVRPVHWEARLEGAPPPDVAEPVRGDEALYSAELWLMTSGSYSVYVEVEGGRGTGTAIVPVQSSATERLGMDPRLGAVLALLGGLLVAGLVRLAGAAVEGALPPGEAFRGPHKRRARGVMAAASAVVALVLYGGGSWWSSVDAEYLARIYDAYGMSAASRVENGWRVVELDLDDERWRRATPLAPDHGKLMHMFLIREPGLDAFAHLHPVKTGDWEFAVAVPPLPAGSYRIYADVTHESGFVQTLSDLVELPRPDAEPGEPPRGLEPDPDDSWHAADAQDGRRHEMDDGSAMVWELDGPLVSGEEVDLAFSLLAPGGSPAPLEPYMGMMSHAALLREDGSVFIHLHPTGTISMAAQQLFAARGSREEAGPTAHGGMDHEGHAQGEGAVTRVGLPYEFPRPGSYRLWVQVKSAGRVYTGVFDAEVVARKG